MNNNLYSYFIFVSIIAGGCSAEKEPNPNVIFIMSDDHATKAVGAYDGSINQTPKLDQLAAEGMIFQQAFVTNSICAPSRAVVLTGKYSHLNGVKDNNTAFDGAQVTLPKLLQQAGYETAIIGKWHLKSKPMGFDYWNILPGQGDYYNPAFIKNGKDTLYEGYVTEIITKLSIKWLAERKQDRPFFLMVHHKAPHRNWMPALQHLDLYNETLPVPPTFYDSYHGREHLGEQELTVANHMSLMYDLKMPCDTCTTAPVNRWTKDAYKNKLNRMTEDQREAWNEGYSEEIEAFRAFNDHQSLEFKEWKLQRYLQDYLRTIHSIDESVGEINTYLKENNLENHTVIIYTSDQGFFLGEHGLFDKRYMYEESLQIPLIIKYPALINAGAENNSLVLNLDFAPTLLDLCGQSVPESMQGKSMVPLFNDNQTTIREAIYYQFYEAGWGVPRHYGIRTDRYKLIRFDTDPVHWELYDLKEDPKEINNLYIDQQGSELLDSLKAILERKREQLQLTDSF